MFESMTYETILAEMLSKVTNDIDKREGSVIYDALAPAAYHLAQVYFQLDNYKDLFFVDTAVDEYLDRKAADYGITRKIATYAIRKIITSGAVGIGTRWAIADVIYHITEQLETNVYQATCETAGEIGNTYSGNLENIDNVSGVTAMLTDIILSGSDLETDDALRNRIQEYLSNPSQEGNIAQYKNWATEYPGIGIAKVFPLWDGGNTVKIAITDSKFLPASNDLITKFQEYMDPGVKGLGNGIAPIGSKVTVTGGTKKSVTVAANVVLADGYTEAEGVSDAISTYLASITYDKNSVSYMRIGSVLLDCDSIAEVGDLTINNDTTDLILIEDEIPVLVGLNITVVTA